MTQPTPSVSDPRHEAMGFGLWLTALRRRSVWTRGLKLGLSVGLAQALINQGDVWMAHAETAGTVVKTIVSPLVTFGVALVSAAATCVERLKVNS